MAETIYSYGNFLAGQKEVYDRFGAATPRLGVDLGVTRDPFVEPKGAFIAAWRFPDRINSAVEELSLAAAEIIPATPYGPDNTHSTADVIRSGPSFVNPAAQEDGEILEMLAESARETLGKLGRKVVDSCAFEFTGNLHNGTTMIATGVPTREVWQINHELNEQFAAANQAGVRQAGFWGGHITTGRPLESVPAADPRVSQLRELLARSTPFGDTRPESLDVGYFKMTPELGFEFTTHERFELGPNIY